MSKMFTHWRIMCFRVFSLEISNWFFLELVDSNWRELQSLVVVMVVWSFSVSILFLFLFYLSSVLPCSFLCAFSSWVLKSLFHFFLSARLDHGWIYVLLWVLTMFVDIWHWPEVIAGNLWSQWGWSGSYSRVSISGHWTCKNNNILFYSPL